MSSAQILSIDQGTTNTKALLIDAAGRVVRKASAPMTVICPQPGWIEQDADGLWRSVQEVIAECLSSPECGDVAALAVTNQRESMTMDTGEQPDVLMADGGASRNDQLMQFQADILGKPVVRNLSADLSAIGAAWLAGLAAGMWGSVADLEAIPRKEDRFEPTCGSREREQLYRGWRESVARVLHDARALEAAT